MGLDPRTPGSCPELKAGAKPLSHQGCPKVNYRFNETPIKIAKVFFCGNWRADSKIHMGGAPEYLSQLRVRFLILAQVLIPGSWDQVPHWAPCEEPASPSAYVSASSLCVSLE